MCYHDIEQKIQRYGDFNSISNRVKKSWLKEGYYSDFNQQSGVVKEGRNRNKKLEKFGVTSSKHYSKVFSGWK